MKPQVFPRRCAEVAAAIAGPVIGIRLINHYRYSNLPGMPEHPLDLGSYDLNRPGIAAEHVEGKYLNGFLLMPLARRREGIVVTWGSSDGGCDWRRACALADAGYQVLALFYFGQPNQVQKLSAVPLEFFGEVLDYLAAEGIAFSPLTVIGSSKGAELAALLPAFFSQIDNVVLFTPTEYVYQGLDLAEQRSSWTWKGQDIPYVSFRYGSIVQGLKMLSAKVFGYPVRLREIYETAASKDPNADVASIDFKEIPGNILAFAGEDDLMWPADKAVHAIADSRADLPNSTKTCVYPGAGHILGVPGRTTAGFVLGGSAAANDAALLASAGVLTENLERWHYLDD